MKNWIKLTYAMFLLLGISNLLEAQKIVVFDFDSNNNYAVTAANNISSDVTVITDATNLPTDLTAEAWDLVLIDSPSFCDGIAFSTLPGYINSGGKVVMSYWDWDESSCTLPAEMPSAFGYMSTSTFSGLSTSELTAADNPIADVIFEGNPGMPHSTWFNQWFDDGDAFGFTEGMPIAYILEISDDPVIVKNPSQNAIAAFLIDEWSGVGAVELWEGMANCLLSPPSVIPSISQWGLFILGLLISSIALVTINSRKTTIG